MAGLKRDPSIPQYTRCERCKVLVKVVDHLPFCSDQCKKDQQSHDKLRLSTAHRRMRRSV